MSENSLSIIILAAGKGTRMKSDIPKVMHKVACREMINLVIDSAKSLKPKNISVVTSNDLLNFKEEITSQHPDVKISFILQEERLGTGHAVKIALDNFEDEIGEKCVILYGDTPLISTETISKLIKKLDSCDVCIGAFESQKPNMYGRVVIDDHNNLIKIVEFKDANTQQKKIKLCNSGIMSISGFKINKLISEINNDNASKEYYLTDIVKICRDQDLVANFIEISENEVLGVNSKIELAEIELIKQNQIRNQMMQNGVTLIDPPSVFFAFDTIIGKDCVIYPNVFFGKNVTIEDNVEIKSFSHIEGANIEDNCVIGPFARIRPESNISKNCKIGNFVEVKKSKLSENVKINHLSYIGDSEIGENSNIGAGTITCNYNGKIKFKTKIGKNSFIGSNCSLIAPIEIGDNCLVGAGSVITKKVDDDDLAIARTKQNNIKNGASKFWKKN